MGSLLTATLVTILIGAGAAPPADKPEPKEEIDPDTLVVPPPAKLERRQPEEDIGKLIQTEHSILEADEQLGQDIARRSDQLERLRRQREIVERDLARATESFDAESKKLDEARRLVRRRLRALIQLQRTRAYQLLFARPMDDDVTRLVTEEAVGEHPLVTEDSLVRFREQLRSIITGEKTYAAYVRRIRAIKILIESDKRRIAGYREQLEEWRVAKADLERRRANLVNTEETISNLLQELEWDRREKRALIQAVRQRPGFHAKLGQELDDVDGALIEKVPSLADDSRGRLWFEENKGKLPWPIRKSRIIGRYGTRVHPEFGTRTRHRGLDLGPEVDTDEPVPIHAIYWGYVAYAGWIRGLGNTVILDHTRGYMSLYGHLAEIDVKLNEKVKSGQTVGIMGDSGSLYGKRLYFEIRKDGKAINPMSWLR